MLKVLLKIDRIMAWLLMLCMILFFVSGYGLTKGIMDRSWASTLHCQILVYATVITFGYHSAFAAHLSFRRWKVWNPFMKVVLFLFYAAYVAGFVYVHHYYKRPLKKAVTTTSAPATTAGTAAPAGASKSNVPELPSANKVIPDREFTLEELAKDFNGKEGRPAYDAVKGLVYDFTTVYKDGMHYEHTAGRDNTEGFYAAHTDADLAKYNIVGRLKK